MQKEDIYFGTNGAMFVAPTGVRILSRCIASSEYSCTFKYFATLNVSADTLKDIIMKMVESKTEYSSSDKSIVMQTVTERDAFTGLVTADDITSVGEIDMTNHVITPTADFTEIYVHLPNRFGTKTSDDHSVHGIKLNAYNEINFNLEDYPGQPASFKEYAYDGRDFTFNAIALYLNISDGKNKSYNSLYGIYVPANDAEPISKYAYSDKSTVTQSGNSFGFRINLRLVEDDDNARSASTIQTIVDETTNSFSMSMFTDALARMQMIMAEHKSLSDAMSSLYNDVENLKALCDTGTTLAELANKLEKLSAYIDNYMLAIEDKDSLLNMIANINRQMQSILNGEAGPELNVKIPIQSGDGIYFNNTDDSYIINNANQRYHILDSAPFTSNINTRSFTPTTFSNLFPVYTNRRGPISSDIDLKIDVSDKTFRFKQGQSFQFIFKDDINWNGFGCKLWVGDTLVGKFTKDDIQCGRPIFEIVCVDSNGGDNAGGTLQQSSFWSRCINPKYEGTFGDNSIVPITYNEAVVLRDKGALLLNKVYYITDYAFVPDESDTSFASINDDIIISIYLKPSDRAHFDTRAYMSFNTKEKGRVCTWGKYYLTREDHEVAPGCKLKKGYITLIDYNSVTADFDFIHCAIKVPMTEDQSGHVIKDEKLYSFGVSTGEFAQSLQGGDHDSWMTSSAITGSRCSVTEDNIKAIDSKFYNDDMWPAICIEDNVNVSVSSHNDAMFKLPIMHIANCENICIHDCDNIILDWTNDSTIERTNNIFAKKCNYLDVEDSDNLRLWNVSHSTFQHAFNSWVYKSDYVAVRNANAVLLDHNNGSTIEEVTGNSLVILNYYNEGNSSKTQKAILDNVSHNCLVVDNLSVLNTTVEAWRVICNRYDALATQEPSGSTFYSYYVVKKIVYLNESNTTSEDIKSVQVNNSNINDLI